MSYKLLLLLLFGLHCVAGRKNAHQLGDQSAADAWIRSTLFAGKPKSYLNTLVPSNKAKAPIESSWTVAVLKQVDRPSEIVTYLACTGSLIHPQVVLAAAHCLHNTSTDNLMVLAGGGSPDHQQKRDVATVIIHDDYTADSTGNDIALIFLKERFIFNKFVSKTCLAPKFDNLHINCSISSWDLKTRNVAGHPQLMTQNATVVSNRNCQRVLRATALGKEFKMAKDTICIGGGFDGTDLKGNGGAPLVCRIGSQKERFVQVGILSFGFEATILPNVLTNVATHRKWITNTAARRHLKIHSCLKRGKKKN